MPLDPQAIVNHLPDWLQGAAQAALFLFALGIMVFGLRRGHAGGGDEEDKPELTEILASSPVQVFLSSLQTISDHQRLQTEALKVIAAAAGAMAKVVEDDFDERRVHREVERRLAEERRRTNRGD